MQYFFLDNGVNEKLEKYYHLIHAVFYSVEKDKGDPKRLHVHTLINSSTDLSYEEFRSGVGGVAVGDYGLIKDPKEVASYLTKYFGVYDVNYDLLLKEERT